MVYVLMVTAGLALGVWNTWHRLGRTRRARAWSHSLDPDARRHVLAVWPLLATACLLGGVVGLAPDGPVVRTAAGLLLLTLITFMAYLLLPLPVPRFLQPRWYRNQAAARDRP